MLVKILKFARYLVKTLSKVLFISKTYCIFCYFILAYLFYFAITDRENKLFMINCEDSVSSLVGSIEINLVLVYNLFPVTLVIF